MTRAAIKRRRMMRRLVAFATLLARHRAGIYLTMTMLFRISTIQVQTADGTAGDRDRGLFRDSILQALGVQPEENIFSFDPGEGSGAGRQFPLLESIKVVRDYPNTVVVQVTEAVPAYAVQTGSRWLTLSDKFKILSAETAQPEGLCTLYGGKRMTALRDSWLWFGDDADDSKRHRLDTAESQSTVEATKTMEALTALQAKLEEYELLDDVTRHGICRHRSSSIFVSGSGQRAAGHAERSGL